VWDAPDIPEKDLHFGRPSGSAMPLVWTHAEYVTLLRSLRDRCVFDTPPQVQARYANGNPPAQYETWRPNLRIHSVEPGRDLRIALQSSATVRYSIDGGASHELHTRDTSLGLHVADLAAEIMVSAREVRFMIEPQQSFEGGDREFRVEVRA
jgi:glucoamylase